MEEKSVEIAEIQKRVVRANFLDRLAVARVEEEIEQWQTALRVALVRVRADRAVERETLRWCKKGGPDHKAIHK
jgi:hypothetical protein